jgi:hypothetical protein
MESGRFDNKGIILPAAKCRGEDFLPAVSLALTFWGETNFLTLETSPLRQASNSSRRGSTKQDPLEFGLTAEFDEHNPLAFELVDGLLLVLLLLLLLPKRSRSLAVLMEFVDRLVAIFPVAFGLTFPSEATAATHFTFSRRGVNS